jgi:flavin reductase (DIM6/NTAB) family NADH-FMN oxidoreductase RutF
MSGSRPGDFEQRPQSSAPEPTAQQFRLAMRRLAATVSIVATSENGVRHGMTATSVASVSMEPPSLLVSIKRTASIHDPLLRRGRFSVNLLFERQHSYSQVFSGKLAGEDRFDVGAWRQDSHGVPYLDEALANVFCAVDRSLEYGSHTIAIGRVLEARVAHPIDPLIHLDGSCTAVREGHLLATS